MRKFGICLALGDVLLAGGLQGVLQHPAIASSAPRAVTDRTLWTCSVTWHILGNDLRYAGKGTTQAEARASAQSECERVHNSQFQRECSILLKTDEQCTAPDTGGPVAPESAPQLVACPYFSTPPKAPVEVITGVPDTGASRASGRDTIATSTVHVPKGTTRVVFWCHATRPGHDDWCAWTPESSAGCPYFIAKRTYSRWTGADWEVGLVYDNEGQNDSGTMQVFAVTG